MFDGITKGTWMIDENRVKVNKHGCTKYPLRVEGVGLNEINVAISYEIEPNRSNAEFIAFAFNLQQKYDIGLFELVVDTLEESKRQIEYLNDKFTKTGTSESVLSQIDSVLSRVKQNK